MEKQDYLRLSPASPVYHAFREDLLHYYAVRGQLIGPLSFSLNIIDENYKLIIYDGKYGSFYMSLYPGKINVQYRSSIKNAGAVWIDEPHLYAVQC